MADARTRAILRRTLYGPGFDGGADRRDDGRRRAAVVDRRVKALDEAKRLVEAGAAVAALVWAVSEELDGAREGGGPGGIARQPGAGTHGDGPGGRIAGRQAGPRSRPRPPRIADRYDGDGIFTPGTLAQVEMAFARHFGKPLPVSAMGETAVASRAGLRSTAGGWTWLSIPTSRRACGCASF